MQLLFPNLDVSILWLIEATLLVPPFIRIFQKAGYSGAWGLTILVLVFNILMLWVFAFSP